MEKIAIIDLGSNSVRMDLIEISNGREYRYIGRLRRLVKLSEGMGDDGVLKKEPTERTLNALSDFAEKIKDENADKVFAVATAALRRAKNSKEFCDEAKKRTGIEINIIPGEKEAELDLLGVLAALNEKNSVLVDTGGGSTEIIGVRDGREIGKISLPLGAVSLTERFFAGGESEEKLSAAKEYCRSKIKEAAFLCECKGFPMIGLGGSIASAAVAESVPKSELHGYTFPFDRLCSTAERLLRLSGDERIKAGIEKGRENTAVCGLIPTLAVGEIISSSKLIVCTSGIREGILFSYLKK